MTKKIIFNLKHNLVEVNDYIKLLKGYEHKVESFLAVPSPLLCSIPDSDRKFLLAQSVDPYDWGSFTGAVGPNLLSFLKIPGALIGHSEVRLRGYSQSDINKAVRLSIQHGLKPIVCIGELDRRTASDEIKAQVEDLLKLHEKGFEITIAYEPRWAIGQSNPCDIGYLEEIIGLMKIFFDFSKIKFLYGGGLSLETIDDFIKHPELDGLLLGKVSLDLKSAAVILKKACEEKEILQESII